jgi:hypothetical protein
MCCTRDPKPLTCTIDQHISLGVGGKHVECSNRMNAGHHAWMLDQLSLVFALHACWQSGGGGSFQDSANVTRFLGMEAKFKG